MLRDVEAFALVVNRDTQTEGEIDQFEDDVAHDETVDQGRTHPQELRRHGAARAADVLARKGASKQGADDATDTVDAKGIQRVIVSEYLFQRRRAEETNRARGETDDHCGIRPNESRRGSDSYQTGNGAGSDTKDTGLTFDSPFREHPCQRRGGAGDVGYGERHACPSIGSHGRSRIEAEPTHPQ